MGTLRTAVVLAVLAAAAPAAAQPCPRQEAGRREAIDRQLAGDVGRSRTWNLGWGLGLAAAAATTGTFAARPEWAPIEVSDHLRLALLVTTVKATLGAGGRLILPLRATAPPPPTGDPCRDARAAEAALADTVRHQRSTFWLTVIGGSLINVGGGLLLGLEFGAWREAIITTASGGVVLTALVLTQPRGAWQLGAAPPADRPAWQLVPLATPGGAGLALIVPM